MRNNLLALSLSVIGFSIWFGLCIALIFIPDSTISALDEASLKIVLLIVSGAFLILSGVVVFRIIYIPSVAKVAAHGCVFWFFVSGFLIVSASLSSEAESFFSLDLDANTGAVVESEFKRMPGGFDPVVLSAASTSLVGMLLLISLYAVVAYLEKRDLI